MNKSKWLDELLRQNYLVTEENIDPSIRDKLYAQAEAALKLQELVKNEIKEIKEEDSDAYQAYALETLEYLLKKSER